MKWYADKTYRLSGLSAAQKAQIRFQMPLQQHARIVRTSLPIDPPRFVMRKYVVYPGVIRPDVTDSMQFARFLYCNNARLYAGKTVMDIGCGSGIFGLCMSLCGAKRSTLVDISADAVANAKQNAQTYGVVQRCRFVQSDLFANVRGSADVILFSHPFFACKDTPVDPILRGFMAPPSLIMRFFLSVSGHLNKNGRILMSYFDFAGAVNSPLVQGPKYGFDVTTAFSIVCGLGSSRNRLSIYELVKSQ